MTVFNNLLLAIDLSPESDQLLLRVQKLCEGHMDRVNVVHVLKPDPYDLPFPMPSPQNDNQFPDSEKLLLRNQASFKLSRVLERNGFWLATEQIHIRTGEPANEIKQLAHEIEADLVIVGSHCKQGGWLSLPGATTNCVLQGIDSDVMAVRV